MESFLLSEAFLVSWKLIDLKCKVAPENRKSYCGKDIRQKLSDPPQMTNLAGRKKIILCVGIGETNTK